MVTFVHTADVHVGMGFKTASFASKLADQRRREIKETLFGILRHCEDKKIDLLLIAGDLFEEDYVSISDLKDMNHRFGTLTHTKVVIGAGNHDPVIDDKSCYKLIQWSANVHLFGTEFSSISFDELNTEIHSFSWDRKHLPPFEGTVLPALDQDRHHILMLHGDAYGQGDYLSITPSDLEQAGYDYVALGHIHKADFIRPWMAYPGSPEPLDFSEDGDHGFIEGTVGETAAFVPFAKRAFHTLTVQVSGDMTYEAIKDSIGAVLTAFISGEKSHVEEDVHAGSYTSTKDHATDMYRIILEGYLDSQVILDMSALKASFSEMVHYIEFRDETQADLDIEVLKRDYKDTLIGAYITYMEDLNEDADIKTEALYEGLRILLKEQVTG